MYFFLINYIKVTKKYTRTLEDCILNTFNKNSIENFQLIYELPKVLIIVLQRHSFDNVYAEKLHDEIEFPENLNIPTESMIYRTHPSNLIYNLYAGNYF